MRHSFFSISIFATFVALACACGHQTPPSRAPAPSLQPSFAPAEVQRAAREEITRAVSEWNAAGAVAIVIDPATGYVLAAEGIENGKSAPSLATSKAYVTGSTLKTFTIGAALENKTIAETAVLDCATRMYAGAELHDAGDNGKLVLADVLATSSNVGTSRVYETLGLEPLRAMLRRVHIGDPPARPPVISNARQEMVLAIGELAEATPMQMAAAYAAVIDGGTYHEPMFERGAPRSSERVLRPETARTLVAMLENAVTSERGSGKLARVEGLRVAGKTGTGDAADGTYASFVGTVLNHEPRFVALIGIDRPSEDGSGPSAAAPVFARLARRLVALR